MKVLMPPYPLLNFEIKKYFQNNLNLKLKWSKMNDWAYIINLDEYKSIGTQWIAL